MRHGEVGRMRRQVLAVIVVLSLFPFSGATAYDFTPGGSLSLSEEYNDNINLSRTNRTGDFVTGISPSVYCTLRSAASSLTASYSPSFSLYKSHDGLNTTSHAASAQGILNLSEKTGLSFTDTFVLSKELGNLAAVSELGPVRTRTEHRVNTLNGSLSHKISGLFAYSLEAGYIDAYAKDAGDRNSKTYSGAMGLTYARGERSSLSANAKYTQYDYKSRSDANSQDYTLAMTYKLSPTLIISASGGTIITEVQDSGRRSTDFSGGVTLTKQLNRGNAVLSYRQSVVPGLEDGSPLRSRTAGLRLSRSLTNSMSASVQASYTKFKAVAISGTNADEWRIGAALAYSVGKWASISLAYNFIKLDDKTNSANGYYNNTALLLLRLNYRGETAK